jgi:hypothetical protein
MDLGQDKREKPLSQRNDEIAEKHAHAESVKNILEQKLAKDAKVRLLRASGFRIPASAFQIQPLSDLLSVICHLSCASPATCV